MATPEEAVDAYNRKTSGSRWASGVQRARSQGRYSEGVAEFLGVSPGSIGREDDWAAGVEGKQASYERGVDGKGQRWLENYRAAMTSE